MIDLNLLPNDVFNLVKYHIKLINIKQHFFKLWKFKIPKKIILGTYNLTKELRFLKHNFELNVNTDIKLNLTNFYNYIDSYYSNDNDNKLIRITINTLKVLIFFKNQSMKNNDFNLNNIKILIDYLLYNDDPEFIIKLQLFIIKFYNDNLIRHKNNLELYKIISIDKLYL